MYVAVIGAGTMGSGIAHVCAAAGHDVNIRDVEPNLVMDAIDAVSNRLETDVDQGYLDEATKEQALDGLEGSTDLESVVAGADVVIEAVPEELDLKRDTLADVEEFVDGETVLATNTSSLSVSAIAAALRDPGRAVGLHFFNPPHKMGLVEVVLADQTSDRTAEFAETFVEDIGKEPVVVTDTPGFASSRLGVALGVEAMRMVEDGVASVADIDTAMKLGYNHPVGPLELTDRVGLDVRLDICEYLQAELGDRFEPPAVLREKVEAGHTGKKMGRGFYIWEGGEPAAVADEDTDIEDVI